MITSFFITINSNKSKKLKFFFSYFPFFLVQKTIKFVNLLHTFFAVDSIDTIGGQSSFLSQKEQTLEERKKILKSLVL